MDCLNCFAVKTIALAAHRYLDPILAPYFLVVARAKSAALINSMHAACRQPPESIGHIQRPDSQSQPCLSVQRSAGFAAGLPKTSRQIVLQRLLRDMASKAQIGALSRDFRQAPVAQPFDKSVYL